MDHRVFTIRCWLLVAAVVLLGLAFHPGVWFCCAPILASVIFIRNGKVLMRNGKIIIGNAGQTCEDCCPDACSVASDDFTTDELAADYTTVAGTWAVGSGVLSTSSANAVLIHNTTLTGNFGSVSCTVKSSTTGAQGRVIGAYTDSNNFLYGRVTFNATTITLALFSRVGGVDTSIASTGSAAYQVGSTVPVVLCWTGQMAVFRVVGSSLCGGETTLADNQGGLGTATTGGAVTFDDLGIADNNYTNEDCPSCAEPCSGCNPDYEGDYQVVIAGVTNGTFCTNCTAYNGTFEVERAALSNDCTLAAFDIASGGVLGGVNCTVDGNLRIVVIDGANGSFVRTVSAGAPNGDACDWSEAAPGLGNELDCSEFSSHDVPTTGDTVLCNNASATAALSAI